MRSDQKEVGRSIKDRVGGSSNSNRRGRSRSRSPRDSRSSRAGVTVGDYASPSPPRSRVTKVVHSHADAAAEREKAAIKELDELNRGRKYPAKYV